MPAISRLRPNRSGKPRPTAVSLAQYDGQPVHKPRSQPMIPSLHSGAHSPDTSYDHPLRRLNVPTGFLRTYFPSILL